MSAELRINLDAITRNIARLARSVEPARTMFAVKADAYGLGLVPVARAGLAGGATSLGVLEISAALRLRKAGFTVPLFAWLHDAHADFRAAIEAGVDLGVSALGELERMAAAGAQLPARVHLKIDTGLHRNGASADDWPQLVQAALNHAATGRLVIAGIWSHFADASPEDDAAALQKFREAVAVAHELGVPENGPNAPQLHLAASSAGLRMPEARFDFVRFGIAAYGVSPFDDVDGPGLGMIGPVALSAAVIAVSGSTAIIDVGSADGLPGNITGESGAKVLWRGSQVPVLELNIDTLVIDAPEARIGEEITIYDDVASGAPTVEQWAAWGDTIGDELLTRLSTRIPRVYVEG